MTMSDGKRDCLMDMSMMATLEGKDRWAATPGLQPSLNQLRVEIRNMWRHQEGINSVGAIINMAESLAAADGLSGEDKYLVMAHAALKRLQVVEGLLLSRAFLAPAPIVVSKPCQ